MKTLTPIAIYHPARLDPDSFLASFVARGEFAAFLLDKLRHMPAVADHQIVIGPRGMGKTSMLRRLAIGIARDPELSARYIPLGFREEQYNVRALDAFWRNCAEALAEWCESSGKPDLAQEIDRSLLSDIWRQSQTAQEAFLALTQRLGGRPVLFIDNLDLILDALTEEQNWELRRALQAPGGPIVFGAAPQMLRQGADRKAAFYEFFQPHMLEPLTETELLQCIGHLADARGEAGKPVREVLASDPQRIRTLHTLTGGNPRVLALLYQLLERTESETVFADLEALLDQMTPFYKARIEEYQTDLQRAVIDAIALNWDPISAHDLSAATAVDITTISSQLSRFKRDGMVEDVQTSGARAGYQLVERFFNIWYLMRHGTRRTRQRIYWLTAFLTSFYAPAELLRMRSDAIDGRSRQHPLYREALEAIAALEEKADSPDIFDRREGHAVGDKDFGKKEGPEGEAWALFSEAFRLGELGQSEDEIAIYDEIVSRFGDAEELELRVTVARALVNKGFRLSELGRTDDESAIYDEIVSRFGDAEDLELRVQVARSLFNKGLRFGGLDRAEDEIAVYDEVVSRFGEAEEPELRVRVARALVNKGFRLGRRGRTEDEIAVYDEVVSRFGDAEKSELRESAARAMFNKGVRLGRLGRTEDEIAVYDEVVSRFGDAEELELRIVVARALFNKSRTLGALGRSEEAIAAYDEVVGRIGDAEELELRIVVARALFNKSGALGSLGRSEEAIAAYDEVVGRFGDAQEMELRESVARALVNKGGRFGELGRSKDELAVYDEVVNRFGDAKELELLQQVTRALVSKGGRLGALGQSEDAIAVYDEFVSRFGVAEKLELRAQVARVLVRKGNIFADQFGHLGDAEKAYRDALHISASETLAKANLAWLLLVSDRKAEAATIRGSLDELHPVGQQLLDAAFEMVSDNFGAASDYLQMALDGDQEELSTTFYDDLLRLLRIAEDRGFGEKLIDWFVAAGQHERRAPVYAAFVAFVRGGRFLLDFSPEVRRPAEDVYRWLSSRRRHQQPEPPPETEPKRRRGRPPKRRSS